MLEFLGHESHIRIDVMEEVLVPRAQVVQAVLAGCGLRKAVLGTLPIAGKAHIACTAIGGEPGLLVIPKTCLLR